MCPQGFHKADYCRLVHAYRGGSSLVSDEMFENIVAPAYYSSRLETPLEIIKSIFRDQNPWGLSLEGNRRMELFLDSEIFSGIYFRNIMGIFMSNVLHIRIESETSNKSEAEAEAEGKETDVVDPVTEKVAKSKSNSMSQSDIKVEEEVEEGAGVGVNDLPIPPPTGEEVGVVVGVAVVPVKNYGAGLFTVYSKLNHSCCCNTVNQGGHRAEVSLIATEDIQQG